MDRPRIVVTLAVAARQADPDLAQRKNRLYLEEIERHGGDPIALDATAAEATRTEAFATMDGLLLSGGADLDPLRYGQPNRGSVDIEPDRDSLEAEAWSAASTRAVPVLGVCRGFQAINVFSGGSLLQDVPGHVGAPFGHGPARTHALRLAPGSRLARILSPARVIGATEVNSYHHQAIRPADLAPGLIASAWASSQSGDLVEGLEAADGRFLFGIQCHPERLDSTPDEFERLWSVFVDACRGAIDARSGSAAARRSGG
jgi:putative glutamine amidotransferase